MIYERIAKQLTIKLLPSSIFIIGASIFADHYAKLHHRSPSTRMLALIGDVIFIIFAVTFIHILSRFIESLISSNRLGVGRAASIEFIVRLIGYAAIVLTTLNFLNVAVGKLLLGGAVVGVILGVAAQQALGNFFASIVLIISHPFSVGDDIVVTSGALGGQYVGNVKDIGLTHTLIKEESGKIVMMPNATLLSSATIRVKRRARKKLLEEGETAKEPKPTNT